MHNQNLYSSRRSCKKIDVEEGEGAIASWDQVTDFGQFIESGIYVFHVESNGKEKIGKFAVVR
jgi:hypothetical protein